MAKKIYCFGNPYIKEDSIALELAEELNYENVEFVRCTNPDFIINNDQDDIIIIDRVKGIDRVKIIKNLDEIKNTKTSTMHDFDLATVLKLLKETRELKNVIIIGIPSDLDKVKLKKEIMSCLCSILGNEKNS